jgi:RNA recognition motif-containing protein
MSKEFAMKIYVGNLSKETTAEQLRTSFEPFGSVDSLNIITDKETGHSKGFGFIEMSPDENAKKAIVGMHGKELGGNPLKVNEANKR